MKTLEYIIYKESIKHYPYQDINQGIYEQGALWMKEYLFKRFKKELQKLTYQSYAGGLQEPLIADFEIDAVLSKIENGDE